MSLVSKIMNVLLGETRILDTIITLGLPSMTNLLFGLGVPIVVVVVTDV